MPIHTELRRIEKCVGRHTLDHSFIPFINESRDAVKEYIAVANRRALNIYCAQSFCIRWISDIACIFLRWALIVAIHAFSHKKGDPTKKYKLIYFPNMIYIWINNKKKGSVAFLLVFEWFDVTVWRAGLVPFFFSNKKLHVTPVLENAIVLRTFPYLIIPVIIF